MYKKCSNYTTTDFMFIIPCIVNQFQKKFQQDDTLVQYFINSCKSLYMFHLKHVERLAGINKILYKCVTLLEFFLELTLLQLPLIPHINNVHQNNLNEQPILAQHPLPNALH
jgi:hypothetical protein